MERMFYLVEDTPDGKVIHYEGFVSEDMFVDLTFAYIPIDKAATIDDDELSRIEEGVTQYPQDNDPDEAEEIFANYFGDPEGSGEHLPFREVTQDTPCGCYWCEGWWAED